MSDPVAAVEWLERARGELIRRPVEEIARLAGLVGTRFLVENDPLRQEALARLPGESGLSPEMARAVLDGMARDWTPGRLEILLRSEFNDFLVLDGFRPAPVDPGEVGGRRVPEEEGPGRRRLRAIGDRVALHVGSGSVPGVCTTSVIRSLLVKTPVLVKPGRGDRVLTELYAQGLQEADPRLGNAVRVAYWEGGDRETEDRLLARVGRVVVYGSDATARSIRDRTPVHTPVVVYHHRSSVAVIGPEALSDHALETVAGDLARAASMFDQRGCVSPHRVWVLGTPEQAMALGEATAAAMERVAALLPTGARSDAERSRVHQLRDRLELRAAAGEPVRVWRSPGTEWTVALESTPAPPPAGAPRVLVLSACPDSGELVRALERDRDHLQTVGMAGLGPWAGRVADALSAAGASRLVPLDRVSFPPAWWHHDGQGPLRALVRWVEWEV